MSAAFMGAFTNKVDRKGRVSVPAQFRNAIGGEGFQGIVAMRSIRDGVDAIEAFALDTMSRLASSLTEPFAPSGDIAGGLFMEAVEVPFDGEGRIVLPDALRTFARIHDHATFLGRGPYFHIWEPEAGKAYRERLFQQLRSERSRLNLSLKGTGGG
ncbi:MAG: division/cell wall cluster transcriptional repressor MraZ [Alphaproteobacteria bacterium]